MPTNLVFAFQPKASHSASTNTTLHKCSRAHEHEIRLHTLSSNSSCHVTSGPDWWLEAHTSMFTTTCRFSIQVQKQFESDRVGRYTKDFRHTLQETFVSLQLTFLSMIQLSVGPLHDLKRPLFECPGRQMGKSRRPDFQIQILCPDAPHFLKRQFVLSTCKCRSPSVEICTQLGLSSPESILRIIKLQIVSTILEGRVESRLQILDQRMVVTTSSAEVNTHGLEVGMCPTIIAGQSLEQVHCAQPRDQSA